MPGRELHGIHFAMEYLTLQNRRCEGDVIPDDAFITAHGKHVIIIGGGDTGADCLGTAHRQGAKSVTQLELLPRPPAERAPDNPWPQWPNVFRVSTAHEEGGERLYAVSTQRFIGRRVRPRPHAARREGGDGPQGRPRRRSSRCRAASSRFPPTSCCWRWDSSGRSAVRSSTTSALKLTDRGNVWRDERWMTNVPGVFTAGDMQRGQSLIVWAIAEGRSAARGVDQFLTGDSKLPAPLA